ncbi:GNAT family N-acetyltransferase [Paenibacillus sp. J5C_2022]|uniref:GNAT family N-acetyltransferase n=1 Tax=Paenibacillus sp. J5C2022 TaxID=2977129 RepID=UPI0021CFCC8F|nr:GNAT family protein [Paenibacillus sp. J5C2022]MCU6713241.1 GNAT family N-acetyltransferase [Paenibacillus sp. J5C2022]
MNTRTLYGIPQRIKVGMIMFSFTSLEGRRVKLVPLELEHVRSLFEVAQEPEIWKQYPITIESHDQMQNFVMKALEGLDRKEQYPFAVYDKELNKFIGSTRYLRISEANNNLNIGSTWYNPIVWRTVVNTETKYLMLVYAFETLNVNRVEIITTTENYQSQKAIERLGAIKEGILRKKYHNLDYIIYSIINDEWKEVKKRLEGKLEDAWYVI